MSPTVIVLCEKKNNNDLDSVYGYLNIWWTINITFLPFIKKKNVFDFKYNQLIKEVFCLYIQIGRKKKRIDYKKKTWLNYKQEFISIVNGVNLWIQICN